MEVAGDDKNKGEQDAKDALIELALDHWRLLQLAVRVVKQLDASEANRYSSKLLFHRRRAGNLLEDCGFRLVSLEGQLFDPGMAATAVNQEDFPHTDRLRIARMVEPIVMGRDGLLRPGTVMLEDAST